MRFLPRLFKRPLKEPPPPKPFRFTPSVCFVPTLSFISEFFKVDLIYFQLFTEWTPYCQGEPCTEKALRSFTRISLSTAPEFKRVVLEECVAIGDLTRYRVDWYIKRPYDPRLREWLEQPLG